MGTGLEKQLLLYKTKPVIMHVIDALRDSGCLDRITCAVSPHSPATRRHLLQNGVDVTGTPGSGYSQDLAGILRPLTDHAIVVPGDLPLLDGPMVRELAARHDPARTWTSLVVTAGFRGSLGLSPGFPVSVGGRDCVHAGISLVNAEDVTDAGPLEEHHMILDDPRIAFNLNTVRDCGLLGVA